MGRLMQEPLRSRARTFHGTCSSERDSALHRQWACLNPTCSLGARPVVLAGHPHWRLHVDKAHFTVRRDRPDPPPCDMRYGPRQPSLRAVCLKLNVLVFNPARCSSDAAAAYQLRSVIIPCGTPGVSCPTRLLLFYLDALWPSPVDQSRAGGASLLHTVNLRQQPIALSLVPTYSRARGSRPARLTWMLIQ